MRFRKKLLIPLALAMIVSSQQAKAGCCGSVNVSNLPAATSAITGAISSAATSITATITTSTASLIAAMQLAVTQIHGTLERQNVVNKTLMETAQDYDKQYRLQEHVAEIDRQFQDSDSACETMAVAEKLAASSEDRREIVSDLSGQALKRNMLSVSQPAAVAKGLRSHFDNFCSEDDVSRGRCKSPADPSIQNADLRADVLLSPGDSMTYTEKQSLAARQFVSGLVNPFPSQPLPKNLENTPQGRAYLASQMSEQRRLAIAEHSMNEIIASREAQAGLGTKVNMPQADASTMGVISHYASKFLDPAWHSEVGSTGSVEALLKQQTRLMAFKVWMDYNSYLQSERIEAVLASQLSMESKAASDALLAAQKSAVIVATGSK